MTQASVASKPSTSSERAADARQARLLLQDPRAYDQVLRPQLRLSTDNDSTSLNPIERDKARNIWEHLSTEPETGGERQAERKQLRLTKDALVRESALAQQKARDLQAQLAQAQEDRFRHPVIFGGAFAILGLGTLWVLERKKRVAVEMRALRAAAYADMSGPLNALAEEPLSAFQEVDAEEWSDLGRDFATNLNGLPDAPVASQVPSFRPEKEQTPREQTPSWVIEAGHPTSTEKELIEALSVQSASGPIAWLRRALGRNRRAVGYRFDPEDPKTQASSFASTGDSSTMIQTRPDAVLQRTTVLESPVDTLEHQSSAATTVFIHQAEASTEKPDAAHPVASTEDAEMEHLLELRTLVAGLCALGRVEEAAAILQTHIELEPMTCAWTYLEYMQLCEQLNRTDEFELIRSAYRKEFNRMAPTWYEPNANVLGLDGYSRATAELCAAWAHGAKHARQVLRSWLIGPMVGRKLVQLPAFHDLFDLYELLEFLQTHSNALDSLAQEIAAGAAPLGETMPEDLEQEFVPTVSLLDLDFEFSSDVTIEKRQAEMAEKAVTVVKPGEFSLDFNVAGAQTSGLFSQPAELTDK